MLVQHLAKLTSCEMKMSYEFRKNITQPGEIGDRNYEVIWYVVRVK